MDRTPGPLCVAFVRQHMHGDWYHWHGVARRLCMHVDVQSRPYPQGRPQEQPGRLRTQAAPAFLDGAPVFLLVLHCFQVVSLLFVRLAAEVSLSVSQRFCASLPLSFHSQNTGVFYAHKQPPRRCRYWKHHAERRSWHPARNYRTRRQSL